MASTMFSVDTSHCYNQSTPCAGFAAIHNHFKTEMMTFRSGKEISEYYAPVGQYYNQGALGVQNEIDLCLAKPLMQSPTDSAFNSAILHR